jgi:hypothetical protein
MEADDKKIEAFIDKLMSADSLEQPSIDFTANVMSKVEAISNSTATVYKPLISKQVWILIVATFLALVGYVIFNEPSTSSGLLERFDLSGVSNPLENISFNFSKTLMYAMVLMAVMFSVQIPILKHYFNNRMSF